MYPILLAAAAPPFAEPVPAAPFAWSFYVLLALGMFVGYLIGRDAGPPASTRKRLVVVFDEETTGRIARLAEENALPERKDVVAAALADFAWVTEYHTSEFDVVATDEAGEVIATHRLGKGWHTP